MTEERKTIELSLVIPVYNGSRTIGPLVEHIQTIFMTTPFEVILVNDGSNDESEMVCWELAEKFPQTVGFVHLSRNFGEHNAVLAGLSHARGQYVAVLDDDGQNPPEEIMRMLQELKRKNFDVVYGHYIEKKHSSFRNAGSWFNDRVATFLLQKPKDLYFSSFKVMNRFLVNEIIKYRGPYPYTDGLIYRTTRTREALAKHVFEFFDQTAATFSLRRTTRLVFQRRGANCNCDRQTLDYSKYDLWDSNGARKYRLFRRRRADDSRACWRISGAALSGSNGHTAICRSLHGARWSQKRIVCCRVNQS